MMMITTPVMQANLPNYFHLFSKELAIKGFEF
jgi:hypothetical protein